MVEWWCFWGCFPAEKGQQQAAWGRQQGPAEMKRKREESERKLPWCFFLLELFTWLQLKGVYMAEISPPKIISLLVTIRY